MCSGSKTKVCSCDLAMEGVFQEHKDGICRRNSSRMLEYSAAGDLAGFVCEVEEKGRDVDEVSVWYGRRIGSKKMGFEQRTPLLIAALYGSTEIVKYVIGTGKVDVNKACGSDKATALHCAAAGGSHASIEIVKLLIGASANVNCVDANGNRPCDVVAPYLKSASISKRKTLLMLLKGIIAEVVDQEEEQGNATPRSSREGSEKKEYPVDVSLPDINNGLYGSDEFRIYSFKVKPCSRAYSHDWTECPFVHPGENARRRDPRKYHYTCIPCPEFKKGTCAKGDGCEYAHGVFESWLHPAQYKTRLCKDEIGCSRKVCFFAHKPEELRPLYASTGSAMPSPKSVSVSSMEMSTLSPISLGSSSLLLPTTSTPPMSPVACSSPMASNMWQNKSNLTPPTLQLPGSRLKTSLNARDLDLEIELLGLESIRTQQQLESIRTQQHLLDEMASLSSPYNRIGDLKPTNLNDAFGSLDPSLLSQLQSLSPRVSTTSPQLQSPTGLQMRQNMNQLRASYPSSIVPSSPVRKPSSYGFDSSAAVAAAVMNSRSAAFSKRSQSFVARSSANHHPCFTAAASHSGRMSSGLSDWSSPDGKLDWGFNGEEVNKLKKSASFGIRSGNGSSTTTIRNPSYSEEPDVSWVHSLVKDVSSTGAATGAGLYSSEQNRGGSRDMIPPWVDQLYIEQEQMVA